MSEIHFGTDGWRARLGEDFTVGAVRRVADAIGRTYAAQAPGSVLLVGYDTRAGAEDFARALAETVATHGLIVRLSDRYLPTPALCWAVAHDPDACGGVMLTASHNPAEYLGVKLRMSDGGASPVAFSDLVEAAILDEAPDARAPYETTDLLTPYLEELLFSVDVDVIREAGLRVVVDPLYGAAQGYLAALLCAIGVDVHEIHAEKDETFGGLHPEPIPPWTDDASAAVLEGGFDAAFVNDGDADRIGAIDARGRFVNAHRIFALVIAHLVEDLGRTGRVVRTLSGSELIARQCARLGLPLTTTPIGFKWIYEEMLAGDVLIGGEESGGIGIPEHVLERDGLLMAMLLVEMMALHHKGLGELVDDMLAQLGACEYGRRDLALTREQMERFLSEKDALQPASIGGIAVSDINRTDGVKFILADGSWLLLRPSGTEPLVRVYAEAESTDGVEKLLDNGCALVKGD